MAPLVPVIISGGAGTRLWPLSREMAPKAFMRLPDGDTLLGKTAARALALPGVTELLTVTNRDLYFHTKDLYAGLGARGPWVASYILEPFGRNTAPAVALAAMAVEAQPRWRCRHAGAAGRSSDSGSGCVRRGGGARGGARTRGTPRDVRDRADARRNGIRLSRMRRRARRFRRDAAAFRARRFVEKPDAATARSYLDSGKLRLELRHVLLYGSSHSRRAGSPCSNAARRDAALRGVAAHD